MLSIENARPTHKQIQNHLEMFERFCLGETRMTSDKFMEINRELSIGAVLLVGARKYHKDNNQKYLIWRGLDNKEHNLGLVHDANILRDYPGFNAQKSNSLGGHHVKEAKIIASPTGKGNISVVTMADGSTGIGPNYRTALRNAALKMEIKKKFNYLSLSSIWKAVWGHA